MMSVEGFIASASKRINVMRSAAEVTVNGSVDLASMVVYHLGPVSSFSLVWRKWWLGRLEVIRCEAAPSFNSGYLPYYLKQRCLRGPLVRWISIRQRPF
jgi:hypothetical protein